MRNTLYLGCSVLDVQILDFIGIIQYNHWLYTGMGLELKR